MLFSSFQLHSLNQDQAFGKISLYHDKRNMIKNANVVERKNF